MTNSHLVAVLILIGVVLLALYVSRQERRQEKSEREDEWWD